MKKNCTTCKHLEYYDKESPESLGEEGFYCEGRDYATDQKEANHLDLLKSAHYRLLGKKCHQTRILGAGNN